MRRAVQVLLFCVLIAETGIMFSGQWSTPLSLLGTALFERAPIKVRWIGLIMLVMAFLARPKGEKAVAKPMTRMIWYSIAASAAMVAYGVLRGGDYKQALFQVDTLVLSLFFGLLVVRVFRTPEDFVALGKVIVYAGIWRSLMAILFYFVIIRTGNYRYKPEYCTTHDDTVLFTLSIIIALFYALEVRTRKARRFAMWVIPLLLIAIQLNNRRLAWLSLTGALFLVYLLFRPSVIKRKINRVLLIASPFLLSYVLVGKKYAELPNPPSVFKPLSAIFSASDKNNLSTKSRDAENIGLLVTLIRTPVLGTGFGHEYIEVDNTLAAREFAQYRYVPHNSVLGFFAFAGILGFFGIWMVYPTCVFFNVRTYRSARDPVTRVIAGSSVACVLIFLNQAYGDMGLFCFTPTFLMAVAHASAARLPILSGAWPAPSGGTRNAAGNKAGSSQAPGGTAHNQPDPPNQPKVTVA